MHSKELNMIGVLWFDPDINTPLLVKLERLREHIIRKHDMIPNCCDISPRTLEGYREDDISLTEERLGIKIRPSQSIMTNYYYMGVNEAIFPEKSKN